MNLQRRPDGRSTVADYVESLRRICQGVSSGEDLPSVLQAVVDALCDHTPWQLCFVYAMDTNGGFGEIAARRDKVEYTPESPRQRWGLAGNPAIDALRRNEVVAIPEISKATQYPELVQFASIAGTVAAAYVPLNSADPAGRPMVLCVQSTHAVLRDDTQISFLRAVASLGSLAATNARLLSEARDVAARASQNTILLASVIEGVFEGTTSAELLSTIEESTAQSLLVVDAQDRPLFVGRPPAPFSAGADAWHQSITDRSQDIIEVARAGLARNGDRTAFVQVRVPAIPAPLSAVVSRHGNETSASTVISFADADQPHSIACVAASIVLLRDQIAQESDAALQHDVMRALLHGDSVDGYEFALRAQYAGLNMNAPGVLVVLSMLSHQSIGDTGRSILAQAKQRWPNSHLDYIDNRLVLLLSEDDLNIARVDNFLAVLSDRSADRDGQPSVVITRSETCREPADYAQEWTACLQALSLAERVRRRGVVSIHEFGAYRLLLPALRERDIDEYVQGTIGSLIEHDRDHQGSLLKTVETFTTLGGRFQETARCLNIHVSTLRYRLARAEDLLGRDLSDPEARFDIMLATRILGLRRGSERGNSSASYEER